MKYIMQKKNMHGVVRSGDGDGVAGCIFLCSAYSML